jgi:hypothetical protein
MWFENAVAWLSEATNALAIAQLFAAIVTALATFALWRVTKVLAVETKTLAAMTSHTFVVGAFEPSAAGSGGFDVVVRNTGNSAAFDIKLVFTPALPDITQQAEVSDETSFEVSILIPGQRLPLSAVMYRDAPETKFKISVSWSSTPSSKEREQISYETQIYTGIGLGCDVKGTHEIANELEIIRKHLLK